MKLNFDEPLTFFAFKFRLRRCTEAREVGLAWQGESDDMRFSLFSSPVSVHIPLHRFAAVLIHAAVVADSAKDADGDTGAAEASSMVGRLRLSP